MIKKVAIALAALTAIGAGAGFAATLPVASHHLWAGGQTLTKSSCTVTGSSATTDTYVDQNKPTNSFGTATTMLVQPDAGTQKWSFVRFDLAGCSIPTTGGADSATLKLVITSVPKASRTLTVTAITSTWSNSATWNALPSFGASATTMFATGTTSGATVSIPVTIDADAVIKSSTANYGWRISDGGSAASQDTTTFATANASSNHPQLVIDYEK